MDSPQFTLFGPVSHPFLYLPCLTTDGRALVFSFPNLFSILRPPCAYYPIGQANFYQPFALRPTENETHSPPPNQCSWSRPLRYIRFYNKRNGNPLSVFVLYLFFFCFFQCIWIPKPSSKKNFPLQSFFGYAPSFPFSLLSFFLVRSKNCSGRVHFTYFLEGVLPFF